MNIILVGMEGHQPLTYKTLVLNPNPLWLIMNHEALHGSRNQYGGPTSHHRLMVCMVVTVACSLYYVPQKAVQYHFFFDAICYLQYILKTCQIE
jgi:hypothetical protein